MILTYMHHKNIYHDEFNEHSSSPVDTKLRNRKKFPHDELLGSPLNSFRI